jgi:stress response protein YsnF
MNNFTDTDTDYELKTSKITKDDSSNTKNNFSQEEEVIEKIPLFAENFDVTKKTEETQVYLTKKWTTATKKIEIPVKYEELLINDKEFDHYSEGEITEIFSKIKHKITDVFSHHEKNKDDEFEQEDNQQQKGNEFDEYRQQQQHQQKQPSDIDIRKYDDREQSKQDSSEDQNGPSSNGKIIPFSLDDKDISDEKQAKEENVIPLWGEEITINKKMVKIGEIVIRKYQTNEKHKIDVDIKSEKLIVKYPDKRQDEIA